MKGGHPALPAEPRRREAVRLACGQLASGEQGTLPVDPLALAAELGYEVLTMTGLAEREKANPREYIRHTVGEEAFTVSARDRFRRYLVVYDDSVTAPERIRFSLFHEFGHIGMGHLDQWDLTALSRSETLALEEEANIFARTMLCPPPVAELVRGDWRDRKWARLFCMSGSAWEIRVKTMEEDRRLIDQGTADRVRARFREYMFGRRCRECGLVFTDEARQDRCPGCGSRFLVWNPRMESRAEAGSHRHAAWVSAEDLAPRIGGLREPDLTKWWELARNEPAGSRKR